MVNDADKTQNAHGEPNFYIKFCIVHNISLLNFYLLNDFNQKGILSVWMDNIFPPLLAQNAIGNNNSKIPHKH